MPNKKFWSSTVARILKQEVGDAGDNLPARLLNGMRNRLEPMEIAARLARELRSTARLSGSKSLEPVDLNAICAKMDLAVQYRPLAADAILREAETSYVAVINSANRPSRQRMSLAHEIGHLVLYQATGLREAFGHILPDERCSEESREIELLCDCFASELILPAEVWTQQINNSGLSLHTLRKLMDCYGITVATAARRVAEVVAYECAVIAWTPVYDGPSLIKLQPVKSWGKGILPSGELPHEIPNRQEFCVPGSPLYALKAPLGTFGKLSLRGIKGAYLAHSAAFDSKYLATLIIPERFGWGVMQGSHQAAEMSAASQ